MPTATPPGNGLAGTVVKKTGAGTATFEIPIDTNGTVSFRAQGGVSDFEVSQTLDALVIENGAVVTLSDLFTPPAPAEDGFAQAVEPLAGSPLQGVPEPGTAALLLASALGFLTRRPRL